MNYTWSHNIDETSNGGLFQYGFEGNNTILGQIYPGNLRASNYGNSDYDIRHLVNADFVFNPEFHKTGGLKYADGRLAILRQDVLAYGIAVHDFRRQSQLEPSSTAATRFRLRSLAMRNPAVAAKQTRALTQTLSP